MENVDLHFEKAVGERIRRLRSDQKLTLDQLAELSGVSRAMISRVERGEASPTAALLARLCSALGTSLSVFFASEGEVTSPLARRGDQPVWRDPESGYLRRVVSPGGTGSRVDVVEVEFPAAAEVRFPGQQASHNQMQHVWLFEGEMELVVGETAHRLLPGDCLFMNVGDVHGFRNPTDKPARYAVIIDLGQR
ncbi:MULTISPECIES: helix-turn-helix domain-containing protein [Alphaproteobacteria]|uniref:Transcriptional regulator n=2 Tax=Alphaproteobacteria TaxID=28211 RepID=A0A512HE79_9HYPH|nr:MULTISPECIES: helix-turn-helix transcriptional regulator [Alphaproteobacteria]GEO83761.1 transcriptional regulator [Ciceribacter naphthalenivorans]GLR24087.1 transcriptional regulator [Ciceribacter naphthalenivorans]GLT06943.1 transcriptional regulator [Sphingomonas psychrolutea]